MICIVQSAAAVLTLITTSCCSDADTDDTLTALTGAVLRIMDNNNGVRLTCDSD